MACKLDRGEYARRTSNSTWSLLSGVSLTELSTDSLTALTSTRPVVVAPANIAGVMMAPFASMTRSAPSDKSLPMAVIFPSWIRISADWSVPMPPIVMMVALSIRKLSALALMLCRPTASAANTVIFFIVRPPKADPAQSLIRVVASDHRGYSARPHR